MVSLLTVGQKFNAKFHVVEGGTGLVEGVLSETPQTVAPSYVFVLPRHILRTPAVTAIRAGMALQSSSGAVFLVGDNAPLESFRGTLWRSFQLYTTTGLYSLKRRTKVIDTITTLEKDSGTAPEIGPVYGVLEALDRDQIDREMRVIFQQRRVITGVELLAGDIIDNHTVTKVDKTIGLSIGVVT